MNNRTMSVFVLCGSLATGVQAEVLYSTGFEDQPFSLGSIDGQDGWHMYENSPAIQNSAVQSGGQAAGITGGGLGQAYRNANLPSAGQMFSLQCDFMHTGSVNNQSGIFFEGDTGFIAQLISAGIGGDGFLSGTSRYFLGNTNASTWDIGVDLADDQWHHLNMVIDMDGQTITGFADGQYLGSLAINTDPYPTAILDYGIYQYGDGESQSYFDNFSFEAVPAPGAGLILGLAGALAARRRR